MDGQTDNDRWMDKWLKKRIKLSENWIRNKAWKHKYLSIFEVLPP